MFVEQYKLLVQSADNASNRRVNINQYQTSLGTGIIALHGFAEINDVAPIFLVIIAIAGIAASATWFLTIRSLAQLNSAKFDVILSMEASLPRTIFEEEWANLGKGRGWTYRGATFFEKMVPPVFALIHIGVLSYALLGLLVTKGA